MRYTKPKQQVYPNGKQIRRLYYVVFILVFIQEVSQSQCYWTSGGSGSWTNPANWGTPTGSDCGSRTYPNDTNFDEVTIHDDITLSANIGIKLLLIENASSGSDSSLDIQLGGDLLIKNDLDLDMTGTGTEAVNLKVGGTGTGAGTGGKLTVEGTTTINRTNSSTAKCQLLVTDDAQANFAGNLSFIQNADSNENFTEVDINGNGRIVIDNPSGTSDLILQGIDGYPNRFLSLRLQTNATLSVDGAVFFNLTGDTADHDVQARLVMNGNTILTANTMTAELNWESSSVTYGKDIEFDIGSDAQVNLSNLSFINEGPCPYNSSGNCYEDAGFTTTIKSRIEFSMDTDAQVTISDDASFQNNGTYLGADIRFNAYNNATFSVADVLTIFVPNQPANQLSLNLLDDSTLSTKDVVFHANSPSDANIRLEDNSTLQISGGISFIGNASANNVITILDDDYANRSDPTIEFNGTTAQTINISPYYDGPASNDGAGFKNLKHSNTAGLTLANDIVIRGTLDFSLGSAGPTGSYLDGQGYTVTFDTTSTNTNAGEYSHFYNGYMKKEYNTSSTGSFSFPLGDASSYNPLAISAITGTTADFDLTASYTFGNVEDVCSCDTRGIDGATLERVSVLEYWTLDSDIGASSSAYSHFNVTIPWDDDSDVSANASERNDLRVAHLNQDLSTALWHTKGGAVNDLGTTPTSGTITSVNHFTHGDLDSGTDYITLGTDAFENLLPINLISFDASYSDDQQMVNVTWVTASETNNAMYFLERSENNLDSFISVASTPGSGNSEDTENYQIPDWTVEDNRRYYYRLRYVDFNGNSEFSEIVSVWVPFMEALSDLAIFPNYGHGQLVELQLRRARYFSYEEPVIAEIFTASGIQSKTQKKLIDAIDYVKEKIASMPKGLIQIRISNQTHQETLRYLKL